VDAWQLDHDVVALGPLRVAVQRIATSHWRPSGALRSWALAPLHREGDTLLVPCGADESLWLGTWLEDGARAAVRVTEAAGGASAAVELPGDFQLTSLRGPDTAAVPLDLPEGGRRSLRVELDCDSAQADVELILVEPATWAARTGRAAPAPLGGPPPLPPLLG
jgi:hypothetical protein